MQRVLLATLLMGVFVSILIDPAIAKDRQQISDDLYAEIDDIFFHTKLDIKAPGLTYGVVLRNGASKTGSFGLRNLKTGAEVDQNTAFRIASMTKMLTALLILDLQDQGRLSLDDPAEKYVPTLKKWKYPTTDSRKVQVKDLLMHTAGFIWDDPWADRQMARTQEEFDGFLEKAQPFSNVPGTEYEYSNLGYAILGRIIENVSGMSYAEGLKKRIFQPLGMTRSTVDLLELPANVRAVGYNLIDGKYVIEPVLASGTFDPLGGVWTTAKDYTKLVSWMLDAWPARDAPDNGAIPRRVVRALTEMSYLKSPARPLGATGGEACLMSEGYGMGVGLDQHCKAGLVFSHGGGFPGYGSHVILAPEKGIGVFSFANETYAKARFATWDAMLLLLESGSGSAKQHLPPAPGMTSTYRLISTQFNGSGFNIGQLNVADNFLLDQSTDRWVRQFDQMREAVGTCETSPTLDHDGRLSGAFNWICEKGRITGYMTMSPIDSTALQNLQMRVLKRDKRGRDMITDYDWH